MFFRRVCDALLDGSPFEIYGSGEQSRSFTYVADAVDATVAAMERGATGSVYNVGGGEEATLATVIATIEGLAGRRVPLDRQEAQRGDVLRTSADTTKARQSLGWAPAVGLEDGLASELEWVRARRVAAGDPA